MASFRNKECLFCHGPLPVRGDVPENLAFLEHLACEPGCADEFRVWRENMQVDFKGD